MEKYRLKALSALKILVTGSSSSISDNDLEILEKKPNIIKQHSKRLGEVYDAMFKGFFHCAAKGLVLDSEEKVAKRFGSSIEANYPEANEVFLKFARTYWTLRVLVYNLMDNDMEWVGAHLLAKLEQDIGPVFFPFPGPAKISPSKREKCQRQLIENSKADIDIEEFVKGNPILIRDRASKSGCLGIIFLLLSIAALSCWGILLVVRHSIF